MGNDRSQEERRRPVGRKRDLTGQRFGKLTVLSPTEKRMDGGSIVWNCRCDCGRLAQVSGHRLVRGKARSCGCLSAPSYQAFIGKRFGRLTVQEPVDKIRKNGATVTRWRCLCDCGREAIVAQTELQAGDTQSCGCLQKERVRQNLALVDGTSVTVLERIHEKPPQRNNTSGYTGVSHRKNGRWAAYINFKKKRYDLGSYGTREEAIEARRRGEEMHRDFLHWYYETQGKNKDEGEQAELCHD